MSVVEGLKIQIHVCGTYVLSVWFTLLIGFGSVWIFFHHHTSSSYIINPLVILHVIVTCLLHEVEILFLDREGFLVVPTSMSSDGNERGL